MERSPDQNQARGRCASIRASFIATILVLVTTPAVVNQPIRTIPIIRSLKLTRTNLFTQSKPLIKPASRPKRQEETAFSDQTKVETALQNATRMMREAGFEIKHKITVRVDPDLPFMGYSTQRAGSHVIVVAGMAIKSGPLEGLIIHEMGHIYRTETRHPSHKVELLNNVGHIVIHVNDLNKDYQVRLIQQAVNHVQDLYADDISFRVFKKGNAFTDEQASNFFLDWINDTPNPEKTVKDRWLNVGTMLNNCFAIDNLKRHNIPDINQQSQKKVQEFLSQTDEAMRKEFIYFTEFMLNLKENVTDKQFEKDLTEYLDRIVKLAGKKA